MPRISVAVVLIVSFLVLGQTTYAAMIVVDQGGGGDHTTVQAAVSAANAGDTIVINNGTYNENVVLNSMASIGNIILRGANPPPAVKIDGKTGSAIRTTGPFAGNIWIEDLVLEADVGFASLDNEVIELVDVTGLVKVLGNTITDGERGVYLRNLSGDFQIDGNMFSGFRAQGIRVEGDQDMEGIIGGVTGNTFQNASVADGVELDMGTDSGTVAPVWTILIDNNAFSNLGDRGIQIFNRDHRGRLNLTIRDNVIDTMGAEGIRLFSDDDFNVEPAQPENRVLISGNTLTNITALQAIYLRVRDTAEGFFNVTGNTVGGNIDFYHTTGIDLNYRVPQANSGAVGAANPGATAVVSSGTITFGAFEPDPPLPVTPDFPVELQSFLIE